MDFKDDIQLDQAELGKLILGRWAEVRLKTRSVIESKQLFKVEGLSMEKHRERVLHQLRVLVKEQVTQYGFPHELGGRRDPGGSLASFEELVFADPSLQIKFGVQWGLYGSAILYLGTEYHHKHFLPAALNLETPGAFAMTETGHGSDVASIGTTATYDPDTQEFVINTPNRHSYKDYLGNPLFTVRLRLSLHSFIPRARTTVFTRSLFQFESGASCYQVWVARTMASRAVSTVSTTAVSTSIRFESQERTC